MLLEIVSYNGHTLNDATIQAWFPRGMPLMPGASAQYAPRSQTWQKLASKEIKAPSLSFHIELKGTIHTQLSEIAAWFPINDFVPRPLIVKDTADSDRQWYVMGYVISPLAPAENGAGEYIVQLAIDEPLWRTVIGNSQAWAIGGTGDTQVLTVLGNHPARPIFNIGIGAAKTGGYAYRKWLPWYNPLTVENNEPLEVTGGGLNTQALISDSSKSNQLNGAILAGDLTINIDTAVGGGLPTAGGMCYVGSEQIYYTGIVAGVMTVYDDGAGTTGRGWGGTTAASHADNAVLNWSKMTADGRDLRVMINNKEEPNRWLSGINTTTTKVWINGKYKAALTMTLLTPIAGSGAVTTVYVQKTAANQLVLKALPAKFIVKMDNEIFFCTNPDAVNFKFSVTAREEKGTSMGAHVVNTVIRYIEHDMYLMWGNPLAVAPVADDTRKPVINLSTSTNTSWVHAEFGSNDGLRTASWKSRLVASTAVAQKIANPSFLYTGTETELADPWTSIGFAIKSFFQNAVWKPENFQGEYKLYHPAGFTTVTASGRKRRMNTDWPAGMMFQKSNDGVNWATVFVEATPAAAGSFGALSSHSGVTLSGNWKYIRFLGNGSIKGAANNEADMEVQDTTHVINSSGVMQSSFATSVEDNYYLDTVITVVETGDAITLRGVTSVDAEIVVDCDNETITVNGIEGGIDVGWNTVRGNWLEIPSPKQNATCTLRWDDVGTVDVDIDVEWEDRHTT